jgi:hypothetical protein
MFSFCIGLFVGATLGVLIMAIIVAGSRNYPDDWEGHSV